MTHTCTRRPRRALVAALMGALSFALAGCAAAAAETGEVTEVRLGYFANLTHAPALIGVEQGFFDEALGEVGIETTIFPAGPAAIEALTAGAVDAAYIGPTPAIGSFVQSEGRSLVIVAGATSGGAALVVREGFDGPSDLRGAQLASPQLGNTQDVALRTWLADQGSPVTVTGEGDVQITPTDNARSLALFQRGELDGAWLPEPWASRLVIEAGAQVLVDEADLWPNGEFPSTVLVIRADFAAQHPDVVSDLLRGHVAAVDWLNANPADAPAVINDALREATGAALPAEVLERALQSVSFQVDPQAAAFDTLLADGIAAGTQKNGSIDGLIDLKALNLVLTDAGAEPVADQEDQ